MKNLIYGLVDPTTNEIRYVGKSTYGLSRPKDHLKPYKYTTEKNHKANWIKSLAQKNLKPEIVVIEYVQNKIDLETRERYHISKYRELGYKLTNLTEGGEGSIGRVLNSTTKNKISEKMKLYHSSLEGTFTPHNKIDHVIENNIEKKHCTWCKTNKELSEFGKSKKIWDGFTRHCKECHKLYMRKYRVKNPPKKLTPEQWKQSYVTRTKKNQYRK